MANQPGGGSAGFLLLTALLLGTVFLVTLGAVVVYFFVWVVGKRESK
jgi:hypothetical protein